MDLGECTWSSNLVGAKEFIYSQAISAATFSISNDDRLKWYISIPMVIALVSACHVKPKSYRSSVTLRKTISLIVPET